MRTISEFSTGRDNNYNLLRVLAALFIALYHCYFNTLGSKVFDDHQQTMAIISQIVLNFFFLISGFLIAQSFLRRRDVVSYITARFLRLVPGLFVLSVLICFVMGPLVTVVPLATYFSSLETLVYVPFTTMMDPDRVLPGVFSNNPNPNEIDIAIWTLRYEVFCYVGLLIIGLLGLLARKGAFAFILCVCLVGYGAISYLTDLRSIAAVDHMLHFGLSFVVGVTFFVYRDQIPLHWTIVAALLLIAFLTAWQVPWRVAEPIVILATGYTVFWFAYVPGGLLRAYNKFGDYSYGVYIYHYPVQQVLVQYFGAYLSPIGLFFLSAPLIFLFALVSWHYVERPSLKRLPTLSAKIKERLFGETQAPA